MDSAGRSSTFCEGVGYATSACAGKRPRRLVELISDPSSGELSMSRLGLGVLLLLDATWVGFCIAGIPPSGLAVPVSSMLATITGAVCTVYGVNSFGGAWRRPTYDMMSMIVPAPNEQRPRVPPKPM